MTEFKTFHFPTQERQTSFLVHVAIQYYLQYVCLLLDLFDHCVIRCHSIPEQIQTEILESKMNFNGLEKIAKYQIHYDIILALYNVHTVC